MADTQSEVLIVGFSPELLSECWFLAGPTACGKTALSLHLAQRLQAEIVALDSMTLYRGMDIGTAKPTIDERGMVKHHLIDILDPWDEFSLSEYLTAAEVACREIISRGRIPLFVGGSGLYLRGILRGVFDGPSADWSIRHRLEELARGNAPGHLHNLLRQIDPETAARLHPHDQRRIIRAIEVYELLGKPLSALQQQGPRPVAQRPRHVYWLSPPRDWLHFRIDLRVTRMFAEGLVDEVVRLGTLPGCFGQTARQGLGYKEILDWLEVNPGAAAQNDPDLFAGVAELIQTRTRQFAKRQMTWFRNLEECHAVTLDGTETASTMADRLASMNRS